MRRFFAPRRGVGMVEFALTVPVTIFLFLSFIQLGLVLSAYVSMTNVAREAARAAIVSGPYLDSQRRTLAENAVHIGDGTTGTPSGIAKNIGTIETVAVAFDPPGIDPANPFRRGERLDVSITWKLDLDAGVYGPAPPLTVVSRSSMRIE